MREVGSFLHLGGANLRLQQICLYEDESGNSGEYREKLLSNSIYSSCDGVTDGMGR